MDDFVAKAILAFALAAAVAPTGLRADAGDDQYAVAAGHYTRGRWKLAVEEFEAFRRDFPKHAKAELGLFYQAEAHVQLGQFAEARSLLGDYLQRVPQGGFRPQAMFRLAESSYFLNDKTAAKAGFEQFRREFPADKLNAFVVTYLGEIALGARELPKAKELFEQSLALYPQGPMQDDARFGLARVLEQQGDEESAGRLFLALAAKRGSPLADDAQLSLAAQQYAAKDYAAAIKSFEAFESTFAASELKDRARLGRAWCLFQLGQLDNARSHFQALASSATVSLEARYWLGLTHKAQKKWDEAAAALLEAADAATANGQHHELAAEIVFHAGDALRQAGQAQAAQKQFDRLLQAWPTSPLADDALLGQMRLASDSGDHSAIDRLAAAVESQFPQSDLRRDAIRIRTRSLLARKKYRDAAQLAETLVMPNQPASVEPVDRYLAALAYHGLQRHDQAIKALEPVLAADQGAELNRDALVLQAALLTASSRYAEAIPLLEKSLTGAPADTASLKCRAELAVCFARTRQMDKARSAYSELVIKRPDNELLWSTTQSLAEAAYAAGDFAWSAELFASLAKEGVPPAIAAKGLSGLGWSQYKSGQLATAAETLDRLLTKYPDDPLSAEAAWLRGQAFERLDRADAARDMYRLVIDKYAKTKQLEPALLAAARLHDRQAQDREAEPLYARLAKEFPDSPLADAVLYEWAWVLRDLNQPERADELFVRIRKEHPRSRFWADATFRLAERAFAAKNLETCEKLLAELSAGVGGGTERRTVLREQGLERHVLFLQGQLAAARQQWPETARLMQQVIDGFPEDPLRPLAEYWAAEAAYRQGRFDEAGKRLAHVADLVGERREPWMALVPLRQSQVLAQQKKWKEALELAETIASHFPDFEQQYEADYVIGRALASRGEFDDARTVYQKVVRSAAGGKTETAAMAQWMIGETYFHQRQYDAALREYLRVEILYDYPAWQAAALLQGGKCSEALGQWRQAVELYERLLKDFSETEFAGEAANRVKIARERAKD